jgi:nudix-type nucleoside diphosphatase (YffH/AdpP family)
LERDLLDRGDGITVLLHNPGKGTVLLLRQPRILTTVHGFDDGTKIEACNGMVESEDPRTDAHREVEEETDHRIAKLSPIGEVYASPGGSLELVHIFLGEYDEGTRVTEGGGNPNEGEDIEILEVPVPTAMQWIEDKAIRDARTIIALQHLYMKMLRN